MLLDRLQRLLPRRYEATIADFELRGCALLCAELLDVHGADVLDVGCSVGWYAREALGRGARSVTALDQSSEALAAARQSVPGATFVQGSALELPFDDATFDVVTMFNVIEHLPRGSEARLLAEGARVLRPGGRLALVTPYSHPLPTLADPAWYLGHRHYSRRKISYFMSGAGLRVDRLELAGGLADTLDLLLYYLSRHLLRRERHPIAALRAHADREFERGAGRNYVVAVAQRP